ncbi:MAG: DUF3822 family protein [Saprospiraceae bacterium]|nr:DUF3822 family protein [Saprospiraceae bacterium]
MIQRDFDYSSNDNLQKLSVVLMADSFFYSIFDNQNVMVCHQSYIDMMYSDPQFTKLIKEDTRLQRQYLKTSILVMSGDAHQINIKDDALIDIFPGLELKNAKVEKIPGQALYNYYGITNHQEDLLQYLWPEKNYYLRSFTSLLSAYFIGTYQPILHIHLEDGILYLYVQKEGKMFLYNSYCTKNKLDILYFVLAACQYTGLDPASDHVTISGWIDRDSALYIQLKGYISNITILSDIEHHLHASFPEEIKPHFYFTHHANIQCAS